MSLDTLLNTARSRLPLLNQTDQARGNLSPFTTAPPEQPQAPQAPTPPKPPGLGQAVGMTGTAQTGVNPSTMQRVGTGLVDVMKAMTGGSGQDMVHQFAPPSVQMSLAPILNHGVGGFGSPGADIAAAIMDNVARLRGTDPHAMPAGGTGGSYTGPGIKAGGNRVIQLAKTQLGVPYDMGAYDPAGGGSAAIDCSGLTKWVFSRLGVDLPHSAAQQSEMFPKLNQKQLKPGDLIFYNYGRLGSLSDHVAIYAGNNTQIAASSGGGQVEVQPVDWSHFMWGGATPFSSTPNNGGGGGRTPTSVRSTRRTGSSQQR